MFPKFCFIPVLAVFTVSLASHSHDRPKCLKGIKDPSCPDGWVKFQSSCYKEVKKYVSWSDARDECKQFNATGRHRVAKLVEVESSTENEFVKNLARESGGGPTWLGGNDKVTEGKWVWSSKGYEVGFTDWATHQPDDNGGEDCLMLWEKYDYKWNDGQCDHKRRYVCEKSKIGSSCAAGWNEYLDVCYILVEEYVTWSEATTKCRNDYGGKLAEIDNSGENTFVKGLAQPGANQPKKVGPWLGGADRKEGTWRWESNGQLFTFTDWSPNQPDNHGGEDCMHMWPREDQKWNDASCDASMKILCEMSVGW